MRLAAATTPPRLSTLILLTGFSVLSLNMFLPSLASIAADLDADYALVNLSIAGYLGITAVLQIVIGPASDRFGRRSLMLVSLAIFVLASIGCLLATSIWTFLLFRLIQGVIIAGLALSPAIIRDMVSTEEAASLLGYVSMAMAAAPMLGPMIGGVIETLFGWRATFLFFVVGGAMLLLLCWVDLGETNKTPSATIRGQFRTYPELLGSQLFWAYSLCMAFSVGAFYTFLSGVPLVAAATFAMSPAMLGVCLGSITAGFALGSFVSGKFSRRIGLMRLMVSGRVVTCTGLAAGLLLWLLGLQSVWLFFASTIFIGLGNGLTLPASRAGTMAIQPRLAGSASGLSGALTVGGGAVLTSVTGLLLVEEHAAPILLALLLTVSLVSLWAGLLVRRLEARAVELRAPAAPAGRS